MIRDVLIFFWSFIVGVVMTLNVQTVLNPITVTQPVVVQSPNFYGWVACREQSERDRTVIMNQQRLIGKLLDALHQHKGKRS